VKAAGNIALVTDGTTGDGGDITVSAELEAEADQDG